MTALSIEALFDIGDRISVFCAGYQRRSGRLGDCDLIVDDFGTDANCVFLRITYSNNNDFSLAGQYRMLACSAGGWLIFPTCDGSVYWFPCLPVIRRLNAEGHILEERQALVTRLEVGVDSLSISISATTGDVIDGLGWRLSSTLAEELKSLSSLERSTVFLWGSHTRYSRPADLYLHLVHGRVYENRYAWPFKRRICSENDAHALYVTLSGLEKATGKRLYRLLKEQLVLSVLARQGPDGAWRHGEWTDNMEAHFRLHASAMHLLLDCLAEGDDPIIREALARAAGFIARQIDQTAVGTWFLHDELERSPAAMNTGPFKWIPSRVLGKSESNMLVLNTQLDTSVSLDRYQAVCCDETHAAILDSARSATRTVLSLRPAEIFYRMLFRVIGLTLLPTPIAVQLPWWQRMFKRIGWKYLIPRLPDIKTYFPRLVMPGGYIDRELSVRTWAHHYLSINLMDLARYRRRFPDDVPDSLLHETAAFAHDSGILQRWAELKYERYALGFWAEALYHLCLLYPDADRYRAWLAEAIILLKDTAQGLPPSLLGANAEALPCEDQLPCPIPVNEDLKVANLGRAGRPEVLIVNPSSDKLGLVWAGIPPEGVAWQDKETSSIVQPISVPARGWLWGRPLEI